MKLFTGTSYFPVPESYTGPSFKHDIIYYLGDISDQWLNFMVIDRRWASRITTWNEVQSL